MDEPARKRRRTNSPEERDRQSSPLKKPPRRPSFASPTKASLARNYPDLLRATSAASPGRRANGRSETTARGQQARQPVPDETEDRNTVFRAAKSLKRSPIPIFTQDDAEPELPATPSTQGLEEQDDSRRGLPYSSPSRRPLRVKEPVKQSPLKPRAPSVLNNGLSQAIEDGPATQDNIADVAQRREPPDPELEKRKQEKARLQREVKQLEAQVSRCTEEIVKEQQRAPELSLQSSERGNLLTFVTKISSADAEQNQPIPVSSLLCSFLPFSALSIPRPRPMEPERPLPSHRPVQVADPMAYLEMFTSLKFSTQLSLPRGKVFPSSNRVHQKHTIEIAGPQRLLTAQISTLIDALANEIIDLRILRISPWAERELGVYIRDKAEAQDLGNVCWAIDSYWELAKKRAQYWHKCETGFARLIAGHASEDAENMAQQKRPNQVMARRDLNRHLGRDTLVLQDKHVLLKLKWRIGFDWTGEAESEITVEPAFPQVWSEADTAESFKKVPQTFASLLRTKGAFEATRIMTALLFAK
ncbi:hypothetical protein T440DRAFT_22948 [Plenodomus tracheiphilus IPT5]|uniref:Uncharacterized protein n=1 Tax=Plenodomus tracheiphilus IPT5 TaxID=1408161 RepID=A0A6A7BCA9_9PLEO|nr:hypothetical protein T440DRAFT_22948 [Plenodomus tracheiphilus IPT5]